MHAKSVLLANNALLAVAALGLALLPGGCVGAPQTFYAAQPVAPDRPARSRLAPRQAPAPVLSDSEKRRLFQDFQQSQSARDQATTTQEPIP